MRERLGNNANLPFWVGASLQLSANDSPWSESGSGAGPLGPPRRLRGAYLPDVEECIRKIRSLCRLLSRPPWFQAGRAAALVRPVAAPRRRRAR